MKTTRIATLFAALFLLSFAAFGATPAKAKAAPSHGMKFRGSIVSVDEKAKTFEAKDAAGKTANFAWNDATKAPKSPLAAGQNVSIHYMEKGGKNVATVITVNPAQSAHAAKATTTTKKPATKS
ncbi:MAG: hypothetical protein ACTHQM_15670 [Thermoanaerobaculia bacterium]